MVKKQMLTFYRLLFFIALIKILSLGLVSVNAEETFSSWLSSFKKFALTKGVSQSTLDIALKDVKYLEQVIVYDRKQPEFYEDTITYVGKRANASRVKNAKKLLKNHINCKGWN